MSTCTEIHDAVKITHGTGRGTDLLAFPECEEYMTSTLNRSSSWHKSVIQGFSGRFDNKNDIAAYNNLYKERYQGTSGDQTLFFIGVTFSLLAFFTLFAYPWIEAVCVASTSYMMEFYEDVGSCLYPMAICFSISKFFQYKLWKVNDNAGFYFNRLNGMVERRLFDEETVRLPFNEFRPLAVQSREPGGHTRTSLMLFSERYNLIIPVTSCYLADAIICWCYLKQFMDTKTLAGYSRTRSNPPPRTPLPKNMMKKQGEILFTGGKKLKRKLICWKKKHANVSKPNSRMEYISIKAKIESPSGNFIIPWKPRARFFNNLVFINL